MQTVSRFGRGPSKPLAALIVALATSGCGLSHVDRAEVSAWLQCDDFCQEYRQTVEGLGNKAVSDLASALDGPTSARAENMRRKFVATSRMIGLEPAAEREYVEFYLSNFEATYQGRAAVSLADIGTPAARDALALALDEQARGLRSYRRDILATIHESLERATGYDSQAPTFGSLDPSPLGNPGTGAPTHSMSIGGSVVDATTLASVTIRVFADGATALGAGADGICQPTSDHLLAMPGEIDRNSIELENGSRFVSFDEAFEIVRPGFVTVGYCFILHAIDRGVDENNEPSQNEAQLVVEPPRSVIWIVDTAAPEIQPFDPDPSGLIATQGNVQRLEIGGTITDESVLATVRLRVLVDGNDATGAGADGVCDAATDHLLDSGAEIDRNDIDLANATDEVTFNEVFEVARPQIGVVTYCLVVDAVDSAPTPNSARSHATVPIDWQPDGSPPAFGPLAPPPASSGGTAASTFQMTIGGSVEDATEMGPVTLSLYADGNDARGSGADGLCDAGSDHFLDTPAELDRNAIDLGTGTSIVFNETFTINDPFGAALGGTIRYCFAIRATDSGHPVSNTATHYVPVDVTWLP